MHCAPYRIIPPTVIPLCILAFVILSSVFTTQMLAFKMVGVNTSNSIVIDDFTTDVDDYVTVGDDITLNIRLHSVSDKPEHVTLKIVDESNATPKPVDTQIVILTSWGKSEVARKTIVENAGENIYVLYYEVYGVSNVYKKVVSIIAHTTSTHSVPLNKAEFYVSYFHFNPQFRAGDPISEERIVNGSIRNLLLMYERYPKYAFTFEIQSLGIELMAEKYPDVFELFKKLHDRGQLELVVTHYSDQLFIAYPELELRKSIEISDEILKKYNLTRSPIFGCQEWQYSPALKEIMKDYGYTTLVMITATYNNYYNIDANDTFKHYGLCQSNNDSYIIFNRDVKIDDNSTTEPFGYKWLYYDDGEQVNTYQNKNDFTYVKEKQHRYEDILRDYDSRNSQYLTISQLVDVCLERNIPVKQIPEIPCVTQGGNYLWSGEERNRYERDVEIMTLRYQARTSLLSAEATFKYVSNISGVNTSIQEDINKLWKILLLAEVSDSTGWTPRECEVEYSIDYSNYVITESEKIVDSLLQSLDITQPVVIDTRTNTLYYNPTTPEGTAGELPINVTCSFKNYTLDVTKYNDKLYYVTLELNTSDIVANRVYFNVTDDAIAYSPMSNGRIFNLRDFMAKECQLFLSNGWIYLGNNVSLISVQTTRYTSVILDSNNIYFKEDNARPEAIYGFYIYYGTPEDAVNMANRLNVQPCVSSDDITQPIYYT
ncbi:hypothetical protein [Candidatus Borrarchaeum sp.]|uniref:hypothetical protein n=1 Tax=Candidatus Borrarchaeum sp. TaxID=2846742 RepID=UPI00257AF398|nr:hypothetical protein [Candidatus Borrarchaeum sp.]